MMVDSHSQLEEAYRRALDGVLLVEHAPPGVLVLLGDDRLDWLNRLSTNLVLGLAAGEWRRTILINALARIVDVVTLLARDKDACLITSPGRADPVIAWLRGYIFFQDDVQVSAAPSGYHHWGCYGPGALATMRELGFLEADLPARAFREVDGGWLWPVDKPGTGGYELILTGGQAQRLHTATNRIHHSVEPDRLFEILRIESGLPRLGNEVTADTIPLEVGLWDEVNFEKGCYIGQEILARMESRGKLSRRMVVLKFDAQVAEGSRLRSGGRDAGQVTSVVDSPRHGWIALAIVKAQALNAADLTAGDDSIPARILNPLQSMRLSDRAGS